MAKAVRDHIHLSKTLNGSPEFEPSYQWTTVDYEQIPNKVLSLKRGLTGVLRVHALRSSGSVVKFRDWRFVIKLSAEGSEDVWERYEALRAMDGEAVYFVDHYHEADGSDHTSDIKTMVVAQLGSLRQFDVGLRRFYVEIMLADNFTVVAP